MKRKVMATLMAGTLVMTATSCSAGTKSAETTAAMAYNTTVAHADSVNGYEGAVSDAEAEYYYEETAPVLEHYRRLGLVKDVNASQSVEEVWTDVQKAIDEFLATEEVL